MADAEQFREGLAARVAHFDREGARGTAALAEEERQEVLARFPLSYWADLELEQYALGPDGRRSGVSFCRLMEYGTDNSWPPSTRRVTGRTSVWTIWIRCPTARR
ncbi:hypothetical protein ACWC98_19160 [Streptomyces goshikiensis]